MTYKQNVISCNMQKYSKCTNENLMLQNILSEGSLYDNEAVDV